MKTNLIWIKMSDTKLQWDNVQKALIIACARRFDAKAYVIPNSYPVQVCIEMRYECRKPQIQTLTNALELFTAGFMACVESPLVQKGG